MILVIVAIGAQAFLVAQLGSRLSNWIAERYREAAERIVGIALIALGPYLIAQRILA
ncbi:hypothetical protein [Actinosynnema sp. ALI-1.44]|uniref:hypothetical protein n=1 Tax=Actinosynnema sp. ALI-1.44 TaxID=1933779 RepID=UPI00143DE451|nr:hypothetical protein [Actinosynnema sp. ALI-1.44]